jgi:hypothetical protein
MRPTLLLLACLLTATASASPPGGIAPQPEQPSTPTAPPDEPDWARPPPSTGPAEPAGERALRYSRFSAGPGGPTIVVTEILLGLTGGAMLGASYDTVEQYNNAYTGAMMGGLLLGTAGTLYQYFLPVGRAESALAVTASAAGLAGGIAVANARNLSDRERAVLGFAASQAGLFATLLLTSGAGDVSGSDVGLISMTSFYAFLVTGLLEFIRDAESSRGYNYAPVLLAPAVGMAMGGLLAIPLELGAGSLLAITTIPLITSGLAIALAAPLSGNATTGRVVLTTLSATFILTALITTFTYEPPPKERPTASTLKVAPVPVLMAAGRRNTDLAAGPGLRIQF